MVIEINGEGFVIRSWRTGDANDLSVNANNKKISKNMHEEFPHPYTLEDAKKYLAERIKEPKLRTSFAIVINNEVVGGIGIRLEEGINKKTADIGYWLAEKYWGKGIITKAIKLITNYGFDNLNLKRIEARVFPWNKGSQKALEKAGYVYEATLKKSAVKEGKTQDQLVYAKIND